MPYPNKNKKWVAELRKYVDGLIETDSTTKKVRKELDAQWLHIQNNPREVSLQDFIRSLMRIVFDLSKSVEEQDKLPTEEHEDRERNLRQIHLYSNCWLHLDHITMLEKIL